MFGNDAVENSSSLRKLSLTQRKLSLGHQRCRALRAVTGTRRTTQKSKQQWQADKHQDNCQKGTLGKGPPLHCQVSRLRRHRGTVRRASSSRLAMRSEEHTSELQSRENLVCRLLLEKK